MPKRVLDGEALWSSDKLLRVPVKYRGEYAWLIPNAKANGVCEIDARRIWSNCYAYCREDFTPADVAAELDAFEGAGMLFRWMAAGKQWGFFVGINKTGRLPSAKRLDKRHEAIGPTPPAEELAKYIRKHSSGTRPADGQPMADHAPANGVPGFGTGLGSGSCIGNGNGEKSIPRETAPRGDNSPTSKRSASQKAKAAKPDPRHAAIRDFIKGRVQEAVPGLTPPWSGRDAKVLSRLLEENPSWSAEQITAMVQNRFDTEGESPTAPAHEWLPKLSKYAAAPLDRFGKLHTEQLSKADNRMDRIHETNRAVLADCIENGFPIAKPRGKLGKADLDRALADVSDADFSKTAARVCKKMGFTDGESVAACTAALERCVNAGEEIETVANRMVERRLEYRESPEGQSNFKKSPKSWFPEGYWDKDWNPTLPSPADTARRQRAEPADLTTTLRPEQRRQLVAHEVTQ